MRILVGGAVLQPGWRGGETPISNALVVGMQRRGVDVVTLSQGRSRADLAAMGVTPFDLDPLALRRYETVFRREKPDVILGFYDYDSSLAHVAARLAIPYVAAIHIHWPVCPIGTQFLESEGPCRGPSFGRCVAHMGRVPVLTHLGPGEAPLPAILALLVYTKFRTRHRLLSQSTAFVVPGRWMKPFLESRGFENVHVVPNAIDPKEFPFTPWEGPTKSVLYASGSVREGKGWPDFLELAKRVRSTHPEVRFRATGYAGDDVVDGVPRLGREAFVAEMQRTYALAVPALWQEPFGMIALEAMSAGRPVVAYASGALPEVVQDGRDGLLVPPGDRSALVAATKRLLDDPPLAAEMGRHGRERVVDEFTLDRMIDGYLSVANSVVR
ncbi:MAG: glycosyltransferase family 4 protein [Thermoplasmata archaeon]|nr:glycosyltransferase family 4 protein [Thermoplasmata archaeon]